MDAGIHTVDLLPAFTIVAAKSDGLCSVVARCVAREDPERYVDLLRSIGGDAVVEEFEEVVP